MAITYYNDSTKNVFLEIFHFECSEAVVQSHPFSKIYPENTGGRVLLLVKLQTDCSEWWLHTKMTPPRMFSWKCSASNVQKQSSRVIHFRKFIQKIPVVESYFWSNYRLTVQSSNYIRKWLHQECFFGNLRQAFGTPKYYRFQVFEINLFLVAKVTSCRCRTFAYMKEIFPWIIFFFRLVPRNFFSV